MGTHTSWGKVGGRAGVILLGLLLIPLLWLTKRTPEHFDPESWRLTPDIDRTPMARDFVARGLWRDVSRAELVAWFDEPVDASSEASWPLPDALAEWSRHALPVSRRRSATDRPRVVLETSAWGFRLMVDSGIRDTKRLLLVRHYDPNGSKWPENPLALPGAMQAALLAAALRGAAEDLTELSWSTGSVGSGYEERTEWLTVRLVNDRAIDAWVSD